jgi:ornithine cyclodeaminase
VKTFLCDNPNEVVRKADILVTATSSTTPVFTEALKPGTHVDAVGSFRPTMQESPSSVIVSAHKIIVEAKDAALEEKGDLHEPIQEGVFSETGIHVELGKVVSGELPGRENDDKKLPFLNLWDLRLRYSCCEIFVR